jgi:hypothetical protein
MIIKLNSESVQHLEVLMKRTGYSSHVHCLQVMISQVIKKLQAADIKKKAERNLHNI